MESMNFIYPQALSYCSALAVLVCKKLNKIHENLITTKINNLVDKHLYTIMH